VKYSSPKVRTISSVSVATLTTWNLASNTQSRLMGRTSHPIVLEAKLDRRNSLLPPV
jgi:hypothetical protein